jgi:flagellar basal body-associated protein FliL
MAERIKNALTDPEKRARMILAAWVVSLVVLAIGYVIIFYVMFWKK